MSALPQQMQALFDVANMVPIADLRTIGSAEARTADNVRDEPSTIELWGASFSSCMHQGIRLVV